MGVLCGCGVVWRGSRAALAVKQGAAAAIGGGAAHKRGRLGVVCVCAMARAFKGTKKNMY